jgi:hypothetical protein
MGVSALTPAGESGVKRIPRGKRRRRAGPRGPARWRVGTRAGVYCPNVAIVHGLDKPTRGQGVLHSRPDRQIGHQEPNSME